MLLAGASALLLEEGATAAEREALTRGPYLQLVTPGAVTVRWRTDVASSSRLLWGPAPDQLDQSVTDLGLQSEAGLFAVRSGGRG